MLENASFEFNKDVIASEAWRSYYKPGPFGVSALSGLLLRLRRIAMTPKVFPDIFPASLRIPMRHALSFYPHENRIRR